MRILTPEKVDNDLSRVADSGAITKAAPISASIPAELKEKIERLFHLDRISNALEREPKPAN